MEKVGDMVAPSEMAIVDVFTRLIFGDDHAWNEQELSIVQALRQVDHNVYMDNTVEMGIYLRALGVKEMIQLVTRVREQILQGNPLVAGKPADSATVKHPH